ncbi:MULTISPECIES: polyamine ABC transporter ATP-binding protein [Bacteroides]|jgi:spermidine/putrescine transport system ATP-binding protein|uniref:polyamine ABC transporter ATP-binding protein n=1 Tax=Bacteroides TaxID=816 RepID=UPI000E46A616|nr:MULTISPECIES: polyamine ABC transporter ATP-binding protein [Bacteroides]RHL08856.1 polyamine ABC transporter ATP-binding protein [Bacteroides sp. AF39-11AC]
MQKSDCIIGVEHVSKYFGDKAVLNDVNLSVRKGEFVTILGPSGCGKTTLLRLIAGFQTASEGIITIAGKDITQTPPHQRPVNTVFQKYALFPHLNVYNNIAFGLKLKKMPEATIGKKVKQALRMVGMTDYEDRDVDSLSGGQQQRVAIARAIVNEPEVLLLDEPLAALDLKMRKDMQMELKEMHQKLGITFVYVTHDQEEALTLSDTIVVMSEGRIQQIGTPTDIYNEPINSFVADFIGESNILNGLMLQDKAVSFAGHEFECVDKGFGENTPVDVVIRPEDIYIFEPSAAAQLTGTVTSCIFKGVHYEMMVQTNEGYEFMVQDYHSFEAGREVGLLVKPFDIHVMKKERTCNTFEGKLIDATHVEFLGYTFECAEVQDIEPGSSVLVEIDFRNVILEDNEEDGHLTGEVKFILYKGNHYHLTVFTDWDEDIFVDTTDVWDDGDRVGITIAPENIRIVAPAQATGSIPIVESANKKGSAQ